MSATQQNTYMTVEAPSMDCLFPSTARRLRLQQVPEGLQSQSNTILYRLSLGFKRFADIVLSLAGLTVLAPSMLIIAIAVFIDSPGPVLYRSPRVGKDRQMFDMFKFRTMELNADKAWEKLRRKKQREDGLFKMKDDPRVTGLGKFLRAYSLDEFPQLFNVLRGEMSLVGPRPFIKPESDLFEYPYTLRFTVTPGMTGPWQIMGRSNLSFRELCQHDLDYIVSWSLFQDVKLLFKTIPAVVFKHGAY